MNATARLTLWLALVLCVIAPSHASAQKLDNKYRKFPALGVEFKPLKDFSDVPVGEGLGSMGIVAQMDSTKDIFVKFGDGDRRGYPPSLRVFYVNPKGPTTGTDEKSEKPVDDRREAKDFIKSLYRGALTDDKLEGEISVIKTGSKEVGERFETSTAVKMNSGTTLDLVFDVYTFVVGLDKVIFVWDYPSESDVRKKWGAVVLKSMKSFRSMKAGAAENELEGVNSDSSYEDLLEFHQHDVDQTPGWELIETPSKQYLIKTNETDKKDLKEVIQRLEASRELYEKDFPPKAAITSVSVVRLCATRDEFNTYGQTGGGVAGYFNPRSEELVLFFGESGKAMTLSVMAHEGFHQYCHFLFSRAEAHRWFDEGHGDYYGAWKMKGRKLIQEEDMKGGLARIPEIKEMRRAGKVAPLSEHIRYDHPTWQNQNGGGVSPYAQSFALIYFLREGANGNVPSKYWDKQYATILPNYMAALDAGFQESYEVIRQEGRDRLAALDPATADKDELAEAQARIDRPWDFARSDKDKIWDAAMAASWGQIDEKAFEARWLDYIDNVL